VAWRQRNDALRTRSTEDSNQFIGLINVLRASDSSRPRSGDVDGNRLVDGSSVGTHDPAAATQRGCVRSPFEENALSDRSRMIHCT